jgi:hypothetical protein
VRAGRLVIVALAACLSTSCASPTSVTVPASPGQPSASAPPATTEAPPRVIPPRAGLPVVDYWPSPRGLPADPAPLATVALVEGLKPFRPVGAYDRPGGTAKVMLAPTIRGVPVTMPIVERRAGWAAVLVPSVNRRIAWVPPGGWTVVELRDQIIVVRSTHQLRWYRDGTLLHSWRVTLGARPTPTPLGRTFILGASLLPGYVYADTRVFALGAVPDDPGAVPPGLVGAHIGIHTWYHDGDLGKNTSDGCIRLTRKGQRLLLTELIPGTEVVVVDRPDQAP